MKKIATVTYEMSLVSIVIYISMPKDDQLFHVQWNLDLAKFLAKCQGTREIGSLCRVSVPYILKGRAGEHCLLYRGPIVSDMKNKRISKFRKLFSLGASPRRKFESSPFLQRIRRSSVLKLKVRISQNSRPRSKSVPIHSFLEKIVLVRREFQYTTKFSLTAQVLNGWVIRCRLGRNFHISIFN